MKVHSLLLITIFLVFMSACTVNSVGFGGCDGSTCYEISRLPTNWQSSSLFRPDGSYQQTFSGNEGKIQTITMMPDSKVSQQDLAQEYINQLPSNTSYVQDVIGVQHGDMILIELESQHEDGTACFAVFPRVDGHLIIAKGYPHHDQVKPLCKIFRQAIQTYTTTIGTPAP